MECITLDPMLYSPIIHRTAVTDVVSVKYNANFKIFLGISLRTIVVF